MPTNSTTGIYTRVDNSFSNPVEGTIIDETDADAFFDDVEAAVNAFIGVSTTSLAIGTGSKAFTVAEDKAFIPGRYYQAISQADPSNYMIGVVASYSSTTLTLTVTDTGGSGTHADWSIFVSGRPGTAGATGGTGAAGPVMLDYQFNTATSGDPGAGKTLVNNATAASITAWHISETDRNTTGIASLLELLDNSDSSNKMLVLIRQLDDATKWLAFDVSSTFTDAGDYKTATAANGVSGSGGYPDNDAICAVFVTIVGDAGTGANSFETIDCPNGTDPVASSGTDTLTLADGAGITITGDSGTDTITVAADLVTSAEWRSNSSNVRVLESNQVWDAMAEVALTSSSNSVAWDMSLGIDFDIDTLGENTTIANPTNVTVGKKGRLRIVQDVTGSRTVAWGANFEFASGSAPTASTGAGDEDVFYYDCISATRILITSVLDIS